MPDLRGPIKEDMDFEAKTGLKFEAKVDLPEFYRGLSTQLTTLFIINIIFCSLAGIVVLAGIVLMIEGKYDSGTISIISGVLSELLGNIFIRQYKDTLHKVSEEYVRALLWNNMNQALNLAQSLPTVDMHNNELRYGEIREILRSIMENFNRYITNKDNTANNSTKEE